MPGTPITAKIEELTGDADADTVYIQVVKEDVGPNVSPGDGFMAEAFVSSVPGLSFLIAPAPSGRVGVTVQELEASAGPEEDDPHTDQIYLVVNKADLPADATVGTDIQGVRYDRPGGPVLVFTFGA